MILGILIGLGIFLIAQWWVIGCMIKEIDNLKISLSITDKFIVSNDEKVDYCFAKQCDINDRINFLIKDVDERVEKLEQTKCSCKKTKKEEKINVKAEGTK